MLTRVQVERTLLRPSVPVAHGNPIDADGPHHGAAAMLGSFEEKVVLRSQGHLGLPFIQ